MTLAAGDVFAGYRIEGLLGRGGMGTVYRATQVDLGRPVALKLLAAEFAADARFRDRFVAESRLAASLDHPHIVPIYEAGEADGQLFLAMRLVDGPDLGELLRTTGPLDPRPALELLRGVADALDAAHDRGLIHRDVKPGNLLVARTSRGDAHAYLADFGLVKQLGSDAGLTRSGQLVGSVDYVAPEQIEGRPIDHRVDIYSLACVLYTCLAGQPPYPRESEVATLWAHVQAPAPSLSATRPELAVLDPVIATGMAKDPTARYPTAGELVDAASALLSDGAVPALGPALKADVELPFVGLRSFEEADARFFVGREDDVEALLTRLRRTRFLAVFGPSGSGKSSLVRAGLVPALKDGGVPASADWRVEIIRPGSRPLDTLAARIVRLGPGAAMGATVDELALDPRTLSHATEVILADAPPSARVVWVVDQAEELFTLTADEAARQAAIANLTHAVTVEGGRTVVVIAMRADFYHRCAAYPALAALVADSQYLVSPLDGAALRRVIEEPARSVGLSFEPGLVDTILEDVAERPGAMPLLEHALFELWDRRQGATLTLAGYRDAGGVEGAIAVRAETTFKELLDDEQAIARQVFLRLVQPGEGTEDTRRRAALAEVTGTSASDEAQHVLDVLAAARLVTLGTSEATGEPVVDIAHEALLRAWPRLRDWVDEDREALRVSRRISDAAAEWDRLGREPDALLRGARLAEATELAQSHPALLTAAERAFVDASGAERDRALRARGRRQRIVVGLSIGVAAFFLALSGLAWVQWTQSEAARRDAVAAQADAVAAEAGAVAAQGAADAQRAEAEQRRVEAIARRLVAESVVSADDLPLAALLGLEGLDRFESSEAWKNLTSVLSRQTTIVAFRNVEENVLELAASPDGTRLAVISAVGDDETTRDLSVWDVATWTRIRGPVASSDDMRTLVAVAPAFSSDGSRLVFPVPGGLAILDLASGVIEPVPVDKTTQIDSVAWNGDVIRWVGQEAPDTDPTRLWTWDTVKKERSSVELVSTLKPQASTDGDGGHLDEGSTDRRGRLVPGGKWVITVNPEAGLEVFAAATGKRLGGLPGGDVYGLSQDGSFLASPGPALHLEVGGGTGIDGIQVYSLPGLARVGVTMRPSTSGGGLADFGRGGEVLYWWSGHRTMSTFGVASGETYLPSSLDPKDLSAMAATSAGLRFVAREREIEIVDVAQDARLEAPNVGAPLPDEDIQVELAGNGTVVGMRSLSGGPPTWSLQIVDLVTGKQIREIRPDEPTGISDLRLSPDGRSVLTLHDSGRLVSTSIEDGVGKVVGKLEISDGSLVVGPDGLIAVVYSGRTQVIRPDGTSTNLGFGGNGGSFSTDGRTLAVSNCDGHKVILADATTGSVSSEISIDGCPSGVDFSADDKRLVVVTELQGNGVIELYGLPNGMHQGRISTGFGNSREARFEDSTGGTTVVTGDLRHWVVDPASVKRQACELAGRNLTRAEWARYLAEEPYRQTCPTFPAAPQVATIPDPSPSPETPTPTPDGGAGLCRSRPGCYQAPGHYVVDAFVPRISFELDEGWYLSGAGQNLLAFIGGDGEFLEVASDVTSVIDDAGKLGSIKATPEAFVAWLRSREALDVGDVRPTELAGVKAIEVNVSVVADTKLYKYVAVDATYQAIAGQRIRFIIATIGGSKILVAAEAPAAAFDRFWTDNAQPVVGSISFDR